MATDLWGRDLDPLERRLLDVYVEMKALCAEDLPPVAHANLRAALAAYSNAIVGLGLEYEHLLDLGV
ncbi:MAG TPA: hypothetical protein VKV21_14940 [Solirubrobacteraceae bacterium]|nr:hypothetical protein [Solirubrobacteraceae bacterium]